MFSPSSKTYSNEASLALALSSIEGFSVKNFSSIKHSAKSSINSKPSDKSSKTIGKPPPNQSPLTFSKPNSKPSPTVSLDVPSSPTLKTFKGNECISPQSSVLPSTPSTMEFISPRLPSINSNRSSNLTQEAQNYPPLKSILKQGDKSRFSKEMKTQREGNKRKDSAISSHVKIIENLM